MTSIYPKASAPVTSLVLLAANERADRWMARWQAVVRDRDAALDRLATTEAQLAAARSALAACREVASKRAER